MSITKTNIKSTGNKKNIFHSTHVQSSIQLYHCICTLSHTPQSRLGPVSHLDRNGPLTWESWRDRNSRRDGKQGEPTSACPSDVYGHGSVDGELVSYVLHAMPTVFGLPHSSALVSTRILLLLRNRTGSVRAIAIGVRCGDVNFAWEPEPEPSSHETTT